MPLSIQMKHIIKEVEIMNSKKPMLSSVLIALIPVMFLSISGVVMSITGLNESQSIIAQTIAFMLSLIVGFLIVKKSGITFKGIGFCKPKQGSGKIVFYYIPPIIAVFIIFIPGFGEQNDVVRVLLLMVLTVFVGITEELYFRGIIIQRMKILGIKRAILISSFIFGIIHLPNVLVSNFTPVYVLIQMVFATAFGVAAAVIVLITKSLMIVISWHFLHNFAILAARPNFVLDVTAITLHSVQMLIMIIYATVLWKKIPLFE